MYILFLPAYFFPEHAASQYLGDNRNQAFADCGYEMVVYAPVPTRGISKETRNCMEEIFIAIMERIAAQMPGLSLIDEDYGQLETQEDTYPVTFPCVLIGNTDSNWTDIGMGVQKSESFITVRLAIDCYDDTHYSSGSYQKVRERILMANDLYWALQGFECNDNVSELIRVKSRDFSLPGAIKVYEITFSFTVHDESAMQ